MTEEKKEYEYLVAYLSDSNYGSISVPCLKDMLGHKEISDIINFIEEYRKVENVVIPLPIKHT